MSTINHFVAVYFLYIQELWVSLAVGFLISGLFFEFIPAKIVEKYLGGRGLKPILISSFIGAALPICCFGTLPVVITMLKRGVRLGPAFAFLVTTPATSVSALIICWKLMGFVFTAYIFGGVIIMGIVMGLIGNALRLRSGEVRTFGDDGNVRTGDLQQPPKKFTVKIKNVLRYAFITLPLEIGLELILGIAIASLIVSLGPLQQFIRGYLAGIWGYVFSLLAGLATYVCSTASVPMADAFLKSGMSPGAAMVYLIAGPVTSYGTILVLKKEFGLRILFLYLGLISALSLLLGFGYEMVVTGMR